MRSRARRMCPVGIAGLFMMAACAAQGDLPDGEDAPPTSEPTIVVSPMSGATGALVEVTASGFEANSEVLIGFGPPQSEYEEVQRVTTTSDGAVSATAAVPEWAEGGREYLWVVADPVAGRPRVVSEPFRVLAAGGDQTGMVTVEGRITDEGVECLALRSDDDELYTLAGSTDSLTPGDRVRVTGQTAEMSICQQGVTINVQEIERLSN